MNKKFLTSNRHRVSASSAGFTLLEMVIAVSIFAIAGALLTGILYNASRVQNREEAARGVSEQSTFVLQQIQQRVKNASLIDMGANATSSTLLIRLRDTSISTIFASGTAIYVTENGQTNVLTNSNISVDSLVFIKYSNPPGKDTVQIDLSLSFVSQNPQFSFSKTFRSAVSRVSAAVFDASLIPGSDNSYDVGLISPQRWRNGNFVGGLTVGGDLMVDTNFNSFWVDSVNHRVGVGTTTLSALFSVGTSTNIFIVNQSGSIGVNTSTPAYTLDVYGTLHTTQTSTLRGVDVQSQKIVNLATPTAGTDAATKAYVDAATGGGTPVYSTAVSKTIPDRATASNIVSGAIWTYGSWSELMSAASSTADKAITQVSIFDLTTFTGECQLDLGSGGAGSESVIGTYRTVGWATAGSYAWAEHVLRPALFVASGTRIAARLACSVASQAVRTYLRYYDLPLP